jgi:UDP-N-acetylmuramate dehydrogenase
MRLQTGTSLCGFNTFGIDVAAKLFAEVRDLDDCRALVRDPAFHAERRLILGGGSNVLFRRDFDGLVVHVALRGLDVVREDAAHVWLRAAAGEVWHDVVRWSVERGLGGIENLALIPGLVGAAPIQNIGAYGTEMCDSCEEVATLHLGTGEPGRFPAADCEFGYRDSVFKQREKDRHLVTAVVFRLQKAPSLRLDYGDLRRTLHDMGVTSPTVRDVSAAVVRIRTAKLPDPAVLGNAGSFFKNPVVSAASVARLQAEYPAVPSYRQADGGVKVPAGWLIEQCGWRGKRVGRAGVHERQALVLVNHGGATGSEILDLAQAIQSSVRERFAINLVPEVEIL